MCGFLSRCKFYSLHNKLECDNFLPLLCATPLPAAGRIFLGGDGDYHLHCAAAKFAVTVLIMMHRGFANCKSFTVVHPFSAAALTKIEKAKTLIESALAASATLRAHYEQELQSLGPRHDEKVAMVCVGPLFFLFFSPFSFILVFKQHVHTCTHTNSQSHAYL